MSEYWKSTPKYWCKFCAVYVKDTKLERSQHEATGRHQGSIQRSLRGLHREQEAQERQASRAKAEVERLNGLVPSPASAAAPANTPKPTYSKEAPKKDTVEDRKKQWAQLAAMGLKVPEEARADVAMAGEWKTISTKVMGEEDKKPLSVGVRKRKVDEEEEEALAAGEMITRKKGWGNKLKSFPGKMGGGDDDVEALFGKVKKTVVKEEEVVKKEPEVKEEPTVKFESEEGALGGIFAEEEASKTVAIKSEASPLSPEREALVKREDDAPAPAVVFKKRKKATK